MAGEWNVPAGTKTKLKVKRKDWNVEAGAVEHKNRPEAIYVVLSSWVKPKLAISKAQQTVTSEPEALALKIANDFEGEVKRAIRKMGLCFDTNYFDPNSIITVWDYAPSGAKVGKRQFFELEINIDTVNTIGMDDTPSPNPQTGRVEMYSFKDLQKHIEKAVDKILMLEVFDQNKSLVSFASKKGEK